MRYRSSHRWTGVGNFLGRRALLLLGLFATTASNPTSAALNQQLPIPAPALNQAVFGWQHITVELEPDEQHELTVLRGRMSAAEQAALLDWAHYLPVGGRGQLTAKLLAAPPDQQAGFVRFLAAIGTQERQSVAGRSDEIVRGTFEFLLRYLAHARIDDARFLLFEGIYAPPEAIPGYADRSAEEQAQLTNDVRDVNRYWGPVGYVANAELAKPGSAPFQAQIYKSGASASPYSPLEVRRERENFGVTLNDYERWHDCGGVVIDKRWILTAAHCIKEPRLGPYLDNRRVRTGTDDIREGGTTWRIVSVVKHGEYSPTSKVNDVAILQIAADAQTRLADNRSARIARLPGRSDPPLAKNDDMTITGWGVTGETAIGSKYRDMTGAPKRPAPLLMAGVVSVVDRSLCNDNENFKKAQAKVGVGQICALGKNRVDACQGDSGGPLTRWSRGRRTVVGLVSYGMGCGLDGTPGVYVDVAEYVGWIEQAKRRAEPGKIIAWAPPRTQRR